MSHALYTLKVEYGFTFYSPTLLTHLFITVQRERNSFLYNSLKDLLVSVFSSACLPICMSIFVKLNIILLETYILALFLNFLCYSKWGYAVARATKALGTECVQGYILVGKGGRYVGLTTLCTFICRLLRNSGSPKGLPSPGFVFY